MAFHVPIFTKFMNTQQHYIQMSYNKFYPNWTVRACVESKAIAVQAYNIGLQEVEAPRISRQSACGGGKVVSPMHWPPLLPRGFHGTHFC
jgi:2-keto-3-deoxy-L-rhamnonate aldolase RhmA